MPLSLAGYAANAIESLALRPSFNTPQTSLGMLDPLTEAVSIDSAIRLTENMRFSKNQRRDWPASHRMVTYLG